jgi:hypothetical protein
MTGKSGFELGGLAQGFGMKQGYFWQIPSTAPLRSPLSTEDHSEPAEGPEVML